MELVYFNTLPFRIQQRHLSLNAFKPFDGLILLSTRHYWIFNSNRNSTIEETKKGAQLAASCIIIIIHRRRRLQSIIVRYL